MTIIATEKLTRKESLALFEATLNNPIAEQIDYTISQEYVATLKEYWGIKELLANFRDANGEDFLMHYERGSLIMSDENTGIDIKYMIIGNSGSREETSKIGEHGEGMKIGALTLVRLGYKVLIHTVGYTIAFGVEYSDLLKTELMYAKYVRNDKTVGTDIFVECKKAEYEKAKQMFLSLVEHDEITENIIDLPNKTKDIYLNGLSHVQKKAIFGYNLKQKGLISNRDRNFIRQSILDESITEFYNSLRSQAAIKKIMNCFLKERNNFDKMMEARLVEKFRFSEDLKAEFRKSLPKKTYFIRSEKDIVDNDKQVPMIVDNKLYLFLEYLDANVISESGDFGSVEGNLTDYGFDEEEELLHSFTFSLDSIPDELEVERCTVEMISLYGKREQGRPTYSLEKYNNFDDKDIIRFSPSPKIFKAMGNNEIDRLFNNLLYLSTYECNIVLAMEKACYRFITVKNADKVMVLIAKKESGVAKRSVSINKTTPFVDEKNYFKAQNNFLYVFDLRYQSINSIYSYRIEQIIKTNWGYEHINQQIERGVTDIMGELAKTKTKEFFTAYCTNPLDDLYERHQRLDIYDLDSKKKQIRKIFDQLNPKVCLSSDEFYDDAVKDHYAYEVLNLGFSNFKAILTNFIEIPKSLEVFATKQNETIYTIPRNEAMTKGIQIFKSMVQTDTPIEMADILPDAKESHHQDGIIYISRLSTNIPEFIAALILYEYEQVIFGYATPSRDLQSRLTHHPIDKC